MIAELDKIEAKATKLCSHIKPHTDTESMEERRGRPGVRKGTFQLCLSAHTQPQMFVCECGRL